MNLDTGLAVVVLAVLVFYLRLIVLQRERVKRVRRNTEANPARKKKRKGESSELSPSYSIISSSRRDWLIAGVGGLLIGLGVLAYARVLPIPLLQTYWWLPTSIGIVAFSWLFKL